MFDHIMSVIDVLLLIAIVAQGEAIRYYEKEVWRMNAERYAERADWRKQKRSQQLKKETALKTNDSNPSMVSPLPSETPVLPNKITSAKSAADPSMPTDPRT